MKKILHYVAYSYFSFYECFLFTSFLCYCYCSSYWYILYLCMFVDNEARTKHIWLYVFIYVYIFIYHCCSCRLRMLSHVVSFPISSVRCRLQLTVRIRPRTSVVTGRTAKYSGKSLPCQLTWKTGGRYTILKMPHTKSHLMERYDIAVLGVLRGMSH